MSVLRHWKVILALVALFITGAITGTAITLKVVKRIVASRTNPERVPSAMLNEYATRLELTPGQLEKIRPLLLRVGREMAQLRLEMSTRSFQIIRRSNEEIAAELTPEQQQRFELLKLELRERFRQQPPPGKGPPPKAPPFSPLFTKPGPRDFQDNK